MRNLDLKAIYNGNCDPKKTYITNSLFSFKDLKMKNFSAWSRSRLFLPGAEADPIWSEPELAPGPRTSGAAKKSGGSATLH